MQRHGSKVAAAAAVACFGIAVVVAVRGRVDFFIGSHRLPIRGTTLPGVVGWVLLVAAASRMPADRRAHLVDRLSQWIRRQAGTLALALAIGVVGVGVWKGAFVAAGADPYGYVSQADLWAAGNPIQHLPLVALDAPWQHAEWAFAPLGYRPGPVHGTIVPTYPIGLPLQMAALSRALGAWAVFALVPLLGAVSVWIAFDIARRIGSRELAVLATLLVACNPVFLFQLLQPMSDVPVTMWWLAAVAVGFGVTVTSALAAGAAASLAILTRPNTALLLIPLLLHIALGAERRTRRLARAGASIAGALPGMVVTAWANATFYGHSFLSGYGSIASIFDASRIAPMAEQYVSALWHTYTPLLYVAFVASVLASLRGHSQSPELRRLCWTACASAIVLLASYAPYSVFDLRFLLPAVVLLIVASTATMGAWTESWSPTVRALAFGMAATLLPLGFVHQASHAGAWRLHEIFSQRFVESGRRARMLPDGAVLMSIVESGSLRFYGGRLTLRFDWLPAGSLDAAVEYLSNRGRAVYFAGAASELTQFQDTFSTSRVAHAMLAEPVDHPVSDTDVRFIALVPGASGR